MIAETVPFSVDPRHRAMGAIVGGVLGVVAVSVVYLVSLVPAVSDLGVVAFLTGRDGLITGMGGWPATVWLTAPTAAALTGWSMAPRALADDAWSGLGMGLVTYFVGVTIGPLVVFGPMLLVGGSPGVQPSPVDAIVAILGLLIGAVMYAFIGAVLLFPLLGVSALFGVIWARVLRGVVAVSGGAGLQRPSRSLPLAWMLATGVVLGVMWLGASALLLAIGQSAIWLD